MYLPTLGRCYIYHNNLRFLPIFGQKMAFFSKNNQLYGKSNSSWSKNWQFFAKFFGKNIYKIITSVPGRQCRHVRVRLLEAVAGRLRASEAELRPQGFRGCAAEIPGANPTTFFKKRFISFYGLIECTMISSLEYLFVKITNSTTSNFSASTPAL
jgi:hypothetical protein